MLAGAGAQIAWRKDMKEIVILSTQRAGALDGGKGAFIEVETNEGPCQIRFTAEMPNALSRLCTTRAGSFRPSA